MVDRKKLVLGLQSLLSGAVTAEQFTDAFRSGLLGSPDFAAVWSNLEHYLSDADIRGRDRRYREMQDGAMAHLIRLLEEGAAPDRLAAVTFLG